MPGSQHCAYFSKGWNTKRSSRGVGADGSRAPWTAEHPELWPAGALSVGCKDMLGEWRAANKTKYWYSYTSGTGYCCSEHPTCQSSLWSSSGKHCLFYHPIPFFFSERGKFSLWAPVSWGLVSGKGMVSACQQMTPLNSDMAFVAVNQVQGKGVI